MSFIQESLTYPIEEGILPAISAKTLDFHYNKHHAGYVTKLNAALVGTEYEGATDIVEVIRATIGKIPAIYNNAAQAFNHSFYWKCMIPGGAAPSERVVDLISRYFESIEKFSEKFNALAGSLFGSGWCWLIWNVEKQALEIMQTFNAGTPIEKEGCVPLLVVDVWEHGYYLDYQNRRPEYLSQFLNVVNWEFVDSQMEAAGLF